MFSFAHISNFFVQIGSLKQTFGRVKLLGRTPEGAIVEWMAQLLVLKEQTDPMQPDSQANVAQMLRIIQSVLERPDVVPGQGQSLNCRIKKARTDSYTRTSNKKSRSFPRRKEEPRTGPPKVIALPSDK